MTSGIATPDAAYDCFLEHLASCGNVTAAAKAAGVARQVLYVRRNQDEAFAKRWEEAAHLGALGLEDHARARATDPAKPSDLLTIFLLKGAFPDKYKDRVASEHSGAIATSELSDTERAARIAALLDAARTRAAGQAAAESGVDAAAGSTDGSVLQQG